MAPVSASEKQGDVTNAAQSVGAIIKESLRDFEFDKRFIVNSLAAWAILLVAQSLINLAAGRITWDQTPSFNEIIINILLAVCTLVISLFGSRAMQRMRAVREINSRIDELNQRTGAILEFDDSEKSKIKLVIVRPLVESPPRIADEQLEWNDSISLLSVNELADALLNPDYLKHFFDLRKRTKGKSKRVIVLRTRPRDRFILDVFHAMSEGAGIETAYVKKDEFHEMLHSLRISLSDDTALTSRIYSVLGGQPDICSQSRNGNGSCNCNAENSRLRYSARAKGNTPPQPTSMMGPGVPPQPTASPPNEVQLAFDKRVICIVNKVLLLPFDVKDRKSPSMVYNEGSNTNPWGADSIGRTVGSACTRK